MSLEFAPQRGGLQAVKANDKIALTIREFCSATGLSKSKVYEMLAAGELTAKRATGRTLISVDAALKWFDALPDYEPREVA